MVRLPAEATYPLLKLDPQTDVPLYRQCYDGLRSAILSGQLAPGTRLPATRTLAVALGVSRNTVVNAFDQLLAEGYLAGRVGDGTYVTCALPDELLQTHPLPQERAAGLTPQRRLSQRGALLAATPVSSARGRMPTSAFRLGLPAVDAFPFAIWARLTAQLWRNPPANLLGYGEPAGYRPLREAIAAYLGAARGVRCSADQVIVVAGSQQALDLTARLLLDPGEAVWFEDPGYLGARGALQATGARLVPVPVDREGLSVVAGAARCDTARLVYVTPSHQYPLGVTMSLARRLALLEWASRSGAWVIEDDYDSEFRYAGRPLAALQGLDSAGQVIYVGTFSKVLFPALRLGYLVVPPNLAAPFAAARALADRHSPTIEQAVLAAFMREGHFARHIRRMRALYAERQAALLDAARHHLTGLLELQPAEAGMHLVGWLPAGADDHAASQRAQAVGVDAPALGSYRMEPTGPGGLLLGYASTDVATIRAGVKELARGLRLEA